jgi:hypothetical protein
MLCGEMHLMEVGIRYLQGISNHVQQEANLRCRVRDPVCEDSPRVNGVMTILDMIGEAMDYVNCGGFRMKDLFRTCR